MSAITTLTLSDGSANVVFTPASKQDNTIVWRAPAASVAEQPRIVAEAKTSTAGRPNRKVKYTIAFPYLDTSINDVKSVKTGYINMELNVPTGMKSANITKLRNFVYALLANDLIIDQIDAGNNPY